MAGTLQLGPLTIDRRTNHGARIQGQHGHDICHVYEHARTDEYARLFAAAPAMLEACKAAESNLTGLLNDDDLPSGVIRELLRAAIALATPSKE